MIVVFAAFTFGNFLVVKMIGFTLAVAVFIDATLVRIVIGPALLRSQATGTGGPGDSPGHARCRQRQAVNDALYRAGKLAVLERRNHTEVTPEQRGSRLAHLRSFATPTKRRAVCAETSPSRIVPSSYSKGPPRGDFVPWQSSSMD